MVLGDTKTRGIFLICLGLWLLPLTWTIYVKYERQRNAKDNSSLPLVLFLAVSAAVIAVLLWYEYRKRTGGSGLFGEGAYAAKDDYGNIGAA